LSIVLKEIQESHPQLHYGQTGHLTSKVGPLISNPVEYLLYLYSWGSGGVREWGSEGVRELGRLNIGGGA